MPFVPEFRPDPTVQTQALWFVFHEGRLLVQEREDGPRIPRSKDLTPHLFHLEDRQYIGVLDGLPCFAAGWPAAESVPDFLTAQGLRSLFWKMADDQVWVAGRANHLVHWSRVHRFCGQCGSATVDKTGERAKRCPDCGLVNYPRVSPAVIVAVLREDRILLACSSRFPNAYYSVLAGFVEPGETLEGCVKREIREEVGLEVDQIRYFASQPWPFPDSIMVGFTAQWADGDIHVDGKEILKADWFAADNLPEVPPRISIARQLIDWFVANNP